ncbi:MAG: YggS family pyridoxal phosphate-dependent enzyme [Candidatus Nealsonbacteria bacterium]|nr:YggS family pyridoxal phosphate-dependent enzyme [Candidatus Nealsonbacteria bacterium]
MLDPTAQIAQNVAGIRDRIDRAARRCGRGGEDVTLVAVTKYVTPPEIRAVVEAGCTDLGESRPQQLWQRAEAEPNAAVRWHLIGHLQRNKVRRTLPAVAMIQSVDTPRLVEAVDRIAEELSLSVPILLEVNVSQEPAKHGFSPDAVEPFLARAAGLRSVQIRGLMCMARLGGGSESAREDFARLRKLRDRLDDVCPESISLDELSMGMSGDYEVAIEEGATIVRVGSALFEGAL